MQNAMVVCILNLKAKNLAGAPSHGMVLCGEYSDGSTIELLTPPEGCVPGDQITFKGFGREPLPELASINIKDENGKRAK